MSDVTTFTRALDERFLDIHHRRETAFWNTRMAIADESAAIAAADIEMKRFLGDVETLAKLRELLHEADGADAHVLRGWILNFERNAIRTSEGRALYEETVEAERALNRARTEMSLGFLDPATGAFTRASSVALANGLSTGTDEAYRRACREGLQSIETFVLSNGFPEIVRLRNRFARAEGLSDFFEHKVRTSEGFGKETVFRLLDDLEARTREKARVELDELAARAGASALQPWNLPFHAGGSLATERDPYFRFEDALERWMRTFAALGVRYRGARLTLDLVERPGKYENGFMHGPNLAFVRDGELSPAVINFTANAIPNRVGSGQRAIQTLFHEGGHAAHFANVQQRSPCFAHESAPMSAAHAETQAIFADSVLGDSDWQTRYGRNANGEPIPFELIERTIRTGQRFQARRLRSMLAISYAEKAIYELSDEEVTADRILEIVRETESRLVQTPGGAPHPTLAVPHLLSWESSAYYHSYVLARMAVQQTRCYFLERDGHIADNPRIGADLARVYWSPGNSRPFLELVEELTGKPLTADALVAKATLSSDEAVALARRTVERLAEVPTFDGRPELDMRLAIVHGREIVVEAGTPFQETVRRFREWVQAGWPRAGGG